MKLTPEQLKLCQDLGRIGGQSKSPKKLESCRVNAAKARAAKKKAVKTMVARNKKLIKVTW